MNKIVQGSVGSNVNHAITAIRNNEGNLETGNVLRRTCQFAGENACKEVCQLKLLDSSASREKIEQILENKVCADENLAQALETLKVEPGELLMIGVTANNVGFADSLDSYSKLGDNPNGWKELPGFNAFFAREDEVKALGRRLADCADINFELEDSEGNKVFGFEHGTRTNMFGSSEYAFQKDGKKMSFTEYVMRQAIEHYGSDPADIKIKLAAAIQAHNFTKHFDSQDKLDEHLPGWYEDGFVKNISKPDWRPGDPVVPEDTWEADTRGMIIHDIKMAMETLGVPAENFDMSSAIDPGDSKGVHSSHQYSTEYGDTRDLYITYVKSDK